MLQYFNLIRLFNGESYLIVTLFDTFFDFLNSFLKCAEKLPKNFARSMTMFTYRNVLCIMSCRSVFTYHQPKNMSS